MSRKARILGLFMLVVTVWAAGCTPPPPPARALPAAASAPPAAAPPQVIVEDSPPPPEPGKIVPVTANEPSAGDPLAPVTWVIWGDYECPFTAKLFLRIDYILTHFGPRNLRLVWRHNPLPFHQSARPLAVAAETVFRLGGSKAFWAFSERVFIHQDDLTVKNVVRWVKESGVDPVAFAEAFSNDNYAAKIDEDIALARKVGVTGTPASFINGVFLSGAQPDEKFASVIAEQLKDAAELAGTGVPAERIYAAAVEKNYKERPAAAPAPPPDTTTVWKVPVGKSPVRGNAKKALVTIVMFGDFQCPFCVKVQSTLAKLDTLYGDKLRFVFKNNPLPFHLHAEPAAQFVAEARAQGGDAKFWAAYKLLYEHPQQLEDSDFADYAKTLGLSEIRVAAALLGHTHKDVLDADMDIVDDLMVHGTPTFFINGRRLVGAQPQDAFEKIIDEEIVKTNKLIAAGTPREKLYDALQKEARGAAEPERIVVPAATAANPAKGAKTGAKVVVVQVFSDFQCPFCKRSEPVMDELIAAFPGKVRVVFRHLPLPMHKQAGIAAQAAEEAFAQKGDPGFWAFAKLLWEDQSAEALGKEGLLKKATEAGLDAERMRRALDNGTHSATVKAAADLAEKLKITGTPAFAVGDYFISGAQPLRTFKRAVALALVPHDPPKAEALHGSTPPPAPSAPAAAAQTGPQLGAKHLLVMYLGSNRAPAGVTRSKAEAKARAEEARKKLLNGAKFEDIVAQYSDEPGAAARGGDLGTFGKGRMVPEFEAGVEKTQVGAISEIVETPFGFHVILRTK